MAKIQSVLGGLDSDKLGKTLVHEHALIGFPGWFLDSRQPKFKRDEALVRVCAAFEQLKDYGVQTVIDPCPSDIGRDVDFYAEIATRTGIQLICAAGVYYEAAGQPATFRLLEEEAITEIFVQELHDGVGETGIRPGIVKIASGEPTMSEYERKIIRAASKAAAIAGVPVLSHTESCHCGHEQVDLVTGAGVCPHNFVVGHSDGTEDIEYQKSLAEKGVFVGFDRFGLDIEVPDEIRIRNFKALVDAGYRDSLLMSHDYVNCWQGGPPGIPPGVSTSEILPHWNMTHIFERIIPQLKAQGMTDADFDQILCGNTQRFLTVEPS